MSEFGFAGDGIMDGMLEGQAPEGQGRSPVQSSPYNPQSRQTKQGALAPNFKFMDIFSGWKMTVNGITALFFIGYALWLVVLYFIRHNEPLANQVIGTPNAGAPTSDYDRILVGGAKFALPIQATGAHGFYTPGAKKENLPAQANAPLPMQSLPAMGDPASFSAQSQMAFSNGNTRQTMTGSGSAAYGYKPIATPGGNNHSKIVHYGRERVIIHHPEPLPGELANQQAQQQPNEYAPPAVVPSPSSNFGSPILNTYPQNNAMAPTQYSNTSGPNFNVPVQTRDGLRLRTFTNR